VFSGKLPTMKRTLLTTASLIVAGLVVYYLTQGRSVFEKKPRPEPPELGMSLEEFEKGHASLEGRFREQEEFIQRAAGKRVHWTVRFKKPATLGDRVQILFGSKTNPLSTPVATGELSIAAKDRVFALRSEDLIKIDGILKEYAPNSLTVEISEFEFVRPSPGSSPTK